MFYVVMYILKHPELLKPKSDKHKYKTGNRDNMAADVLRPIPH